MAKYVGFKIGKAHESHVISEYYCGGCGWPVTDHDSFCPECGGAFRECDASNLEDENAKLRELCREMLLYIAYPYVCVRPEVLIERARELGMEACDGRGHEA